MSKVVAVVALSLCFGTAAYASSWSESQQHMGVAAHVWASDPAATPEIDPAGAMAGLTLLALTASLSSTAFRVTMPT